MIKTGGGQFDPAEPNIYFLASNVDRMRNAAVAHDNLLIAVNELRTASGIEHLEAWLRMGKRMFIDSGIFNLTNDHARAHPGVTMDQALALPPEAIDGFGPLFDRYCEVIDQYGRDCWGYIELDQGGRENKMRTRARLEGLGFRPIPVYHPFNDGWEYFDYLAENYDRICFGNVVQATSAVRLRLVATAWERHRKYPNLWIHLLGMTPNRFLYAMPINSADSSAWLSSVRWSGYKPFVMGQPVGDLPKGFQYKLGSAQDSEIGSRKAATMAAYGRSLHANKLAQPPGQYAGAWIRTVPMNETKVEIVVRFQVEGFHFWPEAPEHRRYLANQHRHLFFVEARIPVFHEDREVEFHDLLDFCKRRFPTGDMETRSCEHMAAALAGAIKNRYQRSASVAVYEDNEVGAVVYSAYSPLGPTDNR